MSTGLDCCIWEDDDGAFWYKIEDPASNSLAPEYFEYGPFPTITELSRDYARHPNPGGYSVDLKTITYERFAADMEGR